MHTFVVLCEVMPLGVITIPSRTIDHLPKIRVRHGEPPYKLSGEMKNLPE